MRGNRVCIESLEARCLLSAGPRLTENLGRGVVAVRASTTQALVSWRLLGLDPSNIAFNVYRTAGSGSPVKLNGSVLTGGTNFTDSTANFSLNNSYFVKPVVGGLEQSASGVFTLSANHVVEPVVRVPLRDPGAGYQTRYVWVGDLDGDGEYDFVIDRISIASPAGQQRIEAYKRDGTFLWDVDLGPSSTNTYNIEPGAATIDVGNWDGVAVCDMDSDGKAEVLLKTANGVRFGNGQVLTAGVTENHQFISVLNGMTGAERARVGWATDYISDGPMGMMFGTGSVDGVHPSLYVKGKNRVGSGAFNMMVATFSFNGTSITQNWKWKRGNTDAPDGHNIRIVDVDRDGKDEFADIGFVLNSDGTFRYSLAATGGVVHGDRWHVGDFDPARPGLEGYGVQQDNPSGLYDYYYDAATGEMIWQHVQAPPGPDVGRGMASDIDPRYPGYEVWAFNGVFNAATNTKITDNRPYPQLSMQWDGDVLGENLNDGKIENYDYATDSIARLLTLWKNDGYGYGELPLFYGDIMGDWREEVVMTNLAGNSLTIFTTPIATTTRLYTLAQNPQYRNCMSTKGYYQSNQLDYFLGAGMTTPPTPNIAYVVPDLTAPTVESATFAYEIAHRFTVQFSEPLKASSVSEVDLVIHPTSYVGNDIVPYTYTYNSTLKLATFYLLNPLPDGNYTATMPAGSVKDAADNPLAAAYSFDFFALAGDANHDRWVDISDLAILSTNWQQSGLTFSQGDFNYDGGVDANDLAILATHWQMKLEAPVAALPTSTVRRPVRLVHRVLA